VSSAAKPRCRWGVQRDRGAGKPSGRSART